jgi:hypothetical protein
MHRLQYLTIESTLPDPDPHCPPVSPLDLTSLKSLKLQGTCEQCSWVIRHINIPHSATVALEAFDVEESNLKELFEVIGSYWKGGPLSRVEAAIGERQCERMCLSGDPFGISLSTGSSTRFNFKVIGQKWNRSLHKLVMDAVPLKSITTLSIIHISLKPSIFKITLPLILSVTQLVIIGSPVSIFKVFLEDLAAEDSSSTLHLPELTSLHLVHVPFIRDPDLDPKAYGLQVGDLKRWLRLRRAFGAGIRHLKITSCLSVTSGTVNKLQDCIGGEGVVVWDGKKNG